MSTQRRSYDLGLHRLQIALDSMGYDVGQCDGVYGPRTDAALAAVRATRGDPARLARASDELPWMAEARRMLGRHEVRDNGVLARWLGSDGRALGDPARNPWCGDFVETCIRLALPAEPFPGELGRNPYWARNWAGFGTATVPTWGAVLVFSRGSGGHVGFCVGADAESFAVLGGNQSNAVTVARIARARLIASRWPSTFPARPVRLPASEPGRLPLSVNEA